MKKESHFYAFTRAKCPHCHHGNIFTNDNPYALHHMTEMPKECPVCGRSYFPETGFYWGAMYMSYVMTVVTSALQLVVLGLLSHWNIYVLVAGNIVLLALGFPLYFRYARVLWLQLNTPFNMEAFNKAEKS